MNNQYCEGGDDGISAVGSDGVADFGAGVWGFAAGGRVPEDYSGRAKWRGASGGGPRDQFFRCVSVLRDHAGGGAAGRGAGGAARQGGAGDEVRAVWGVGVRFFGEDDYGWV